MMGGSKPLHVEGHRCLLNNQPFNPTLIHPKSSPYIDVPTLESLVEMDNLITRMSAFRSNWPYCSYLRCLMHHHLPHVTTLHYRPKTRTHAPIHRQDKEVQLYKTRRELKGSMLSIYNDTINLAMVKHFLITLILIIMLTMSYQSYMLLVGV